MLSYATEANLNIEEKETPILSKLPNGQQRRPACPTNRPLLCILICAFFDKKYPSDVTRSKDHYTAAGNNKHDKLPRPILREVIRQGKCPGDIRHFRLVACRTANYL